MWKVIGLKVKWWRLEFFQEIHHFTGNSVRFHFESQTEFLSASRTLLVFNAPFHFVTCLQGHMGQYYLFVYDS